VLTPNDFPDLAAVEHRLMDFQTKYELIAKPFKWKFTKKDLQEILEKAKNDANLNYKKAA